MRTLLPFLATLPAVAFAQGAEAAAVQTNLDVVWVAVAGALVFLMQAGFALLETGLTRAKNAANIIMKNVMDASAGVVVFFLVGFGLMFGTSAGGWVGTDGFALLGIEGQTPEWSYVFFFFQAVFAATAATIVSGAVAERVNFRTYLVFSVVIVAVVYPVFGSWAWGGLFNGGGWLEGLGFLDFAGSTVVHSVGAWAALAGTLVVGRRAGSLDPDGNPVEIPGHSIPLAALGVFILWFGWFGFNAGSTTAGGTGIAIIVANTFLAAGAGAIAAMAVTWATDGVPSVTMTMNGVLGGLVGITAGCDAVLPIGALAIGLVAGVLVTVAANGLARYIDDPVSAVAVHGVCGVWGTLAVAVFAADGFSLAQLGVQAVGVGAAFLWTFPVSLALFKALDATMGLRITDEGETAGLDLHEHGTVAYPEFQMMVDEAAGDTGASYRLDAIQLEATAALQTPMGRPPRALA